MLLNTCMLLSIILASKYEAEFIEDMSCLGKSSIIFYYYYSFHLDLL